MRAGRLSSGYQIGAGPWTMISTQRFRDKQARLARAMLPFMCRLATGAVLTSGIVSTAFAGIVGEDTRFSSLCVEQQATGFAWKAGKWAPASFTADRYVVEKLDPGGRGCTAALAAGPHARLIGKTFAVTMGCYSIRPVDRALAVGDGEACKEAWMVKDRVLTLVTVSCYVGQQTVIFDPEGNFHLSSVSTDTRDAPTGGSKDMLYVAYGTCALEKK
jgi:hypothetical protein